MTSVREAMNESEGLLAPLVLDPLMARLAEMAGFRAGYVGGGAMGFAQCCTEANLSLTKLVHVAVEIRAHSRLPLILDGTCGWGDPVHVRHTVTHAEAAGYGAIEIEDQILPKRLHHHVGVEHVVPADLFESKIAQALAARTDPDFLIIARTNAARVIGLDEGLRRAEACHRCGADVLLVMPPTVDDLRIIGERLPPPLMYMLPPGGVADIGGLSRSDLVALGFRLIVDAATPFFAMTAAAREAYSALAAWRAPPIGADVRQQEAVLFEAAGLSTLLEVEKRTVGQ